MLNKLLRDGWSVTESHIHERDCIRLTFQIEKGERSFNCVRIVTLLELTSANFDILDTVKQSIYEELHMNAVAADLIES